MSPDDGNDSNDGNDGEDTGDGAGGGAAGGGDGGSGRSRREANWDARRDREWAQERVRAQARERVKAKARRAAQARREQREWYGNLTPGRQEAWKTARANSAALEPLPWFQTAARVGARRAAKTRTARSMRRRGRSVKRGAQRFTLIVATAQALVWYFGYAAHPGGPFAPNMDVSCGAVSTASSVEGQSVAVVMGRAEGDALRRLAGPPPDPRTTQAFAKDAADSVVVSILALKASATGAKEPAKVTAHNAAVQARHGEHVARTVAACAPCPAPEVGGGQSVALHDGAAGVAAAAGVARRAAAAAGFTGPDLDVAVAVAGAESGYRAGAAHHNTDGSTDYGMWQINSVHSDVLRTGAWADPTSNARMAHAVWSAAGRSWSPWTTYDSGAYRAHLPTGTVGKVQNVAAGGACGSSTTAVKATAGGGWGGYGNGRIPVKAMCRPGLDSRALLRCDAAAALDRLNLAYRARFGRSITITDSYRDFASQVRVKAGKGNLAARPGKSNHGWGLALDLGGGVQSFTTSQHAWMAAHAPAAGWVNPSWARPGRSKPEPWHFEYTGTADSTGKGQA